MYNRINHPRVDAAYVPIPQRALHASVHCMPAVQVAFTSPE